MYIDKNKLIKISSIIIGLIITALLIWFGLKVVQRGRAGEDCTDVKITNITKNSADISCEGRSGLNPIVMYSTGDPTNLNLLLPVSNVVDGTDGKSTYQFKLGPVVGNSPTADKDSGGSVAFAIQVSPDVRQDNSGVPYIINLKDPSSSSSTTDSGLAPTAAVPTGAPTVAATAAPAIDYKLCCSLDANSDGDYTDTGDTLIPANCNALATAQCNREKITPTP